MEKCYNVKLEFVCLETDVSKSCGCQREALRVRKTFNVKPRGVAWKRNYCYLSSENEERPRYFRNVEKYKMSKTSEITMLQTRKTKNANTWRSFWSVLFYFMWLMSLLNIKKRLGIYYACGTGYKMSLDLHCCLASANVFSTIEQTVLAILHQNIYPQKLHIFAFSVFTKLNALLFKQSIFQLHFHGKMLQCETWICLVWRQTFPRPVVANGKRCACANRSISNHVTWLGNVTFVTYLLTTRNGHVIFGT